MKKSEVPLLFALLAAFDQRTTGHADVEAWYLALKDVPWDESTMEAVATFYGGPGAQERRWMQPHDLKRCRRKLREDRLERITLPPPNDVEGVPSPVEERAVIRAVGDGVISNQQEAEAYTAWGGSLHVAYLREQLPALDRVERLALTARPVAELIGGAFPRPEGAEEARRALSEPRAAASGPSVPTLPVPCPWRACRAAPGEPCMTGGGRPIPPHPSRQALAQHPE